MTSNGRVWFFIQLIAILLASLWLVKSPWWIISLLVAAIALNIYRRVSWKIWLLRILPLLIIIFLLQLALIPFYRPLISQLLQGNFAWQAWWGPISGLLRLAVPFLVVTALNNDFSNPALTQNLVMLVLPFRRLGFNVARIQIILPLGLRFFPMVLETAQGVRENLAVFDNVLSKQSGIRAQISRWTMVYKTLFVQSLHSATQVGEALAIRGWHPQYNVRFLKNDLIWILASISLGAILYFSAVVLFWIWLVSVSWFVMVAIEMKWMEDALRNPA